MKKLLLFLLLVNIQAVFPQHSMDDFRNNNPIDANHLMILDANFLQFAWDELNHNDYLATGFAYATQVPLLKSVIPPTQNVGAGWAEPESTGREM